MVDPFERLRTMCNHHNDAATTPHTQDRFGQSFFTFGIDIRSRLVEHHQEGVPVQCPGKPDALPLASGQSHPSLADLGGISVRE